MTKPRFPGPNSKKYPELQARPGKVPPLLHEGLQDQQKRTNNGVTRGKNQITC